eukprot:11892637-Alexandrium_andersonii.AAC.1
MIDLGRAQHLSQQGIDVPTCEAVNAKRATRRDYMVVTPALFPHIDAFGVDTQAEFEVHSPVWARLRTVGVPPEIRTAYTP